jgi:hypothetical protein
LTPGPTRWLQSEAQITQRIGTLASFLTRPAGTNNVASHKQRSGEWLPLTAWVIDLAIRLAAVGLCFVAYAGLSLAGILVADAGTPESFTIAGALFLIGNIIIGGIALFAILIEIVEDRIPGRPLVG